MHVFTISLKGCIYCILNLVDTALILCGLELAGSSQGVIKQHAAEKPINICHLHFTHTLLHLCCGEL